MLPRRRCPLWFEVAVAVVFALCWRELCSPGSQQGAGGGGAEGLVFGFWPIVAAIASAIWKGLEVAGKITLEVLKWSVLQLWGFARMVYDGVKAVGKELVKGVRRAWDFLDATYDKVIKPAWQHFWKWFEQAKAWLDKHVRPIFEFLQSIRNEVLKFYGKWIRPILDAIGIAQRVLRILERLGFDWARRLDAQLAELQRRIDAPFRLVLAKINEIVNLVNRVVTANGLFQRVALVRSIERDIVQVVSAWNNSQSKPLTSEERAAAVDGVQYKTGSQVIEDSRVYLATGEGPNAKTIDEWARSLELRLQVR